MMTHNINASGKPLTDCPFCGGTDIWHGPRYIREGSLYRVMCWGCNAQTGAAQTQDEVADAWNIRDERKLVACEQSLAAHEQATRATLEAMAKRAADRAALMNIELTGRVLRFTFVRGNTVMHIECMGTWDDDVAGWKRMLLEPITGETWSVEINPKSWAESEI